ncbi:MAG: hypothetical protein J7M26_06475 [Armatimonadetes bacterium]|nr:hypothetical protein [Armatimonadota bacterium]
MRTWRGILLALAVTGAACGWAQLLEFCHLTDVKVEPRPNGVRIRLVADGVIKPSWNMGNFWQQDTEGQWHRRKMRRFTFLLRNVRGAPASMISIARYPVSHLEFEVPPGARESVGLICTLVLYKDGVIGEWRRHPDDQNRGRADEIDAGDGPIRVDVEASRSRSQLLIFVTTDRPYEAEPKRQEKILAPEHLEVTVAGDVLYVDAVNADLHELLRQTAVLTGLPIYVDDEVERRCSIQLEGVRLREFLRALEVGYGLSVSELSADASGKAYFVTDGAPDTGAAFQTSRTAHIPLRYITAESAFYALPDCVWTYVRPDQGTNSLVVTGSEDIISKVARDVAALDKPVWHTSLRAWVVEMTRQNERTRDASLFLAGGTAQGTLSSDGTLSVSVNDAKPHDVLARLRDLRKRGLVKIKAMPSIAVANGQWGALFSGERQYFWRLTNTYRGQQEVRVVSVEVGTRLACHPTTSGGVVRLQMLLENNNLVSAGAEPTVSTKRVWTTLLVPSGKTVVAGGLKLAERGKERRTPFFARFGPGLSDIFAGRTEARREREVWILLQPQARRGAVATGTFNYLQAGELSREQS